MPNSLNWNAVGRDRGNAAFLAIACSLAYESEAEGPSKFREQLGLDARLVSVDNTQVYVATSSDVIVCAFRGSESPTSLDGFKDWLLTNARNFLILPSGRAGTDFAGAGVGARFHRGFLDALDEIWEPFFGAVDAEFSKKERPVFVTGHSLGGALALLAAWRLQRQMIPVAQVYTFGGPMVGNAAAAEAFAKEFPNKIFRFVDELDLVPLLPTMSLLSNEYGHCLAEVVLKAANSTGTATSVLGQLAAQAKDQVMSATIADEIWSKTLSKVDAHLMANYIAQIDRLT
jgi:hypothetical protein